MEDRILERIRAEAPGYGPLPFWSWNDRLEPEELRRQIRNMKEIGMNGFFMHARGGLETEYLSDEWFEAVEASVDEAKKLGKDGLTITTAPQTRQQRTPDDPGPRPEGMF